MDDGIYFGLPQAEYHALERFSGSGAQDVLVSPATYWDGSYLNPKRAEKEDIERTKKHLIYGDAYHKAVLEPEIFSQIFVRDLDLSRFPEVLTTHAEIKEKIVALGGKVPSGERVFDSAVRLRDLGYTKPIKHLLEAEFGDAIEEWQIVLAPASFDQIEADAAAMNGNEELAPFLRDGQSEVSILWTDDKGVKWKARLDRLQVNRITDLKTFDNSRRNVLDQCLYNAIRYNRLYVQAYVYWTAAELIRAGSLKIRKVQNQAQKDLVEAIRQSPDPFEYWWVFQEKGGIQNVLARQLVMTEEPHPSHLYQAPDEKTRAALRKKLMSPSRIWDKAKMETTQARDTYLRCFEIWPDEPWKALNPVGKIEDEGFSRFWLEE